MSKAPICQWNFFYKVPYKRLQNSIKHNRYIRLLYTHLVFTLLQLPRFSANVAKFVVKTFMHSLKPLGCKGFSIKGFHGGDERQWILTLPVHLRHAPKLLAILDSCFYHVLSRSVLSRSNVVKFVVQTPHIKSEYLCNEVWLHTSFIIYCKTPFVKSVFSALKKDGAYRIIPFC